MKSFYAEAVAVTLWAFGPALTQHHYLSTFDTEGKLCCGYSALLLLETIFSRGESAAKVYTFLLTVLPYCTGIKGVKFVLV